MKNKEPVERSEQNELGLELVGLSCFVNNEEEQQDLERVESDSDVGNSIDAWKQQKQLESRGASSGSESMHWIRPSQNQAGTLRSNSVASVEILEQHKIKILVVGDRSNNSSV